MNEQTAKQQHDQLDVTPPPPIPPIASTAADKDRIDPESPDAKSVAPSDGTGLSGGVKPAPDESSWMQDA